MAIWWDQAPQDERQQVANLPLVRQLAGGADIVDAPFESVVRDVLAEALFASGSDLLLAPIQDVFGWRDRINQPATVTGDNWTYRLPWPTDRLDEIPEARERRDRLRAWSARYARMADG